MFAKHRPAGRGFFIALALCLMAVSTLTVYSFRDALFSSPEPDPTPSTTTPSTTRSTTASTSPLAVNRPVTGVEDTRPAPTTAAPAADPEPDLFLLPLSNTVSAPFSREPVYNATMGDWRTHNGVDFAGTLGDKVMAIADGTVEAVAEDTLWGPVIRIQHGAGLTAVYAGVTPAGGLKAGDTVEAGDTIGALAIVPCELLDGAHLHLELMADGAYLDPVPVINKEVKYTDS